MKQCFKCKEIKNNYDFTKDCGKKDNLSSRCRDCLKEYRKNSPNLKKQQNKASKKLYWKDIEVSRRKTREKATKLRNDLKNKVIEILGGRCKKCGNNDHRVLQIDHVYGGGSKEIKLISHTIGRSMYLKKILKEYDSGKYQLLCANCNWIKRFENSEIGGRKQLCET